MRPEEKAEIILWDWLRKSGDIYFNRTNKLNLPLFKVEGLREIPDLVIRINDGYKIKSYAIEVKSSDKSKNILQADKVIDKYFNNYVNKKTKYLIDGKEIKLDGFLIATNESPKGYLFKKETMIDNTIKKDGESKYNAATKYKIIPKQEGSRTFEFIRGLWNSYGKIRNNFDKKLDVGIIIGNSEDNFSPYLMITNYNLKKERWGQRWWKI